MSVRIIPVAVVKKISDSAHFSILPFLSGCIRSDHYYVCVSLLQKLVGNRYYILHGKVLTAIGKFPVIDNSP